MRYMKTGFALVVAASFTASAAYAHPPHSVVARTSLTRIMSMVDRNTTQSSGRGFNWMRYITVSGILNVDATYRNRGWNPVVPGFIPAFPGDDCEEPECNVPNATDISVNNANLLFDVRINRFTKAHVGLVYQDRVGPHVGALGYKVFDDEPLSSLYSAYSTIDEDIANPCYDKTRLHSPVHVDEAYITLANFARSPFYLRVGREFVPFGHNENPYPITYSLPQLLTQTNAMVVQVGYATSRMHFTIYGFNGPISGSINTIDSSDPVYSTAWISRVRNFGMKFATLGSYRNTTYHVDVAFMRDMRDATFNTVGIINSHENCDYASAPETRRVGGFSAHLDLVRGPFDFRLDYVTALRHMTDNSPGINTRPWAYALRGGYTFHTYNHVSKVNVGYQRAGQEDNILPKYRFLVDYNIVLGRHTETTFEYAHNRDFTNGATVNPVGHNGKNSNVLSVRLGVHF